MSSTRKAEPGGPLRQERWASSSEHERGLLANLVAKRCATVKSSADRELIWFLQAMSWIKGLRWVASELLRERMEHHGVTAGGDCTAKQVKVIREYFTDDFGRFLLRGELTGREQAHIRNENKGEFNWDAGCDFNKSLADEARASSAKRPEQFGADDFLMACGDAACELAKHLEQLCLDPGLNVLRAPYDYFPDLIPVLREWRARWIDERRRGVIVTKIGKRVYDGLKFALSRRALVLAIGLARQGKTFAARAWCEQNSRTRYVEVPPFNDDVGFFRAIAKPIGVSANQNSKAHELRGHIEAALVGGDLMLCLDEAHRLWPQTNLRYSPPSRINWIMQMANKGVPFFLLTTPQFLEIQKQMEDRNRWNAAQWDGRLEFIELPSEIPADDFAKVAGALLPAASEAVLKAVAIHAKNSPHSMASIDSIRQRAIYLAECAGRTEPSRQDVQAAFQEKMAADSNFQRASTDARRRIGTPRPKRAFYSQPVREPGADEAPAPRAVDAEQALAESDSAPSRLNSNSGSLLAC